MYARVNVNFFPYFNSGNKGIGCGLGPIQKIADGEPLGGQISAESAFGAGAGAYTPPAQPQQQYQQPVQQQTYQQPQQYQQPAQPQQQYAQPQPTYPQQQPAQQFDPITGLPITPGGVMGL